ncbi:hypothetical protein WA577_005558 [Blastocystis sp. JDR]
MNCFKTILLTILLLGACCVAYNYNAYNPDRVLLTSVQTLTFSKSQYTTGRRSRPIPQMKCTGGSAGCSYAPATMQCYNRGTDGRDVQWECKAELDNGVSLGETIVSCEGYDYPEDPYILAGSCGVEFKLNKNANYYKAQKSHPAYHTTWYWNPFSWIGYLIGKLLSWCLVPAAIFFFVFMVGFNNISKVICFFLKCFFFPFYLMAKCFTSCLRGPAVGPFVYPQPIYYDNTFGNGWLWYELGKARACAERNYYRPTPTYTYESYHETSYDDDSNSDTHTSTSYASTSRR